MAMAHTFIKTVMCTVGLGARAKKKVSEHTYSKKTTALSKENGKMETFWRGAGFTKMGLFGMEHSQEVDLVATARSPLKMEMSSPANTLNRTSALILLTSLPPFQSGLGNKYPGKPKNKISGLHHVERKMGTS